MTTNEDTAYTFAASDFGFNDTDTGDTLASVKVTTLPAANTGTLALSGTAVTLNQEVTKAQIDANSLTYTPPANANGTGYASFGFKVNDGTDESAAAYTMTIDVTAVNDAATGFPTITGTAQVDQTLTATLGTIADVDRLPETFPDDYSFQWRRRPPGSTLSVAIPGATSSTYTVVAGDLDHRILVRVIFTDGAGNNERRASARTEIVTADTTPPTLSSATVPPTGTHNIDLRFSETMDRSNLPPVSAFAVTVGGAARTVTNVILGFAPVIQIQVTPSILQGETVVVTYTDPTSGNDTNAFQDAAGNDVATFTTAVTNNSPLTNHPATGEPTTTGTMEVGQTLTANRGTIADADGLPATFPDDYSFQWRGGQLGNDLISGATSSTYRLVASDLGHRITVRVSFTDGAGSTETRTSARPTAAVVADATPPTLSGATVPFGGSRISLAFNEALQTTNLPPASAFTVTVGGTASMVTEVLRPFRGNIHINISPEILQGQTVTVTYTDPTTGNDENALQDAAGNDVATFTTGQNTVPAVTNNSVLTNNPATGRPTITGTADVGHTLTANLGDIADLQGLPATAFPTGYSFQWRRGTADIPGETSRTYMVVATDLGHRITVRVSFTDRAGNDETVASDYVTRSSAPDLALDGEITVGEGDRYFLTRDDFKFKDPSGTGLRKIHINSLPDKGWLWLNGFLKPHHLPATIRADSLDYEIIVYIAPGGSGDDFARFTFDVSDGRLKSESNYTMTVNVAPRGEELVVDGDNVLVSTLGQQTYPVAHEVDATRSVAQPLTTGMNGPARDLGGIVVQIAEPSTATPDFDLYTAVAGGSHGLPRPGTKITDLEGSAAAAGLQTFTPASAVELAAGTTYFVVFRATGGSIKLASTASKHDDSGAKPGLTIDRYARAGPWADWARPTTRVRTRMAVLDEVVGHSVEADPPTVEGTPVLSGAGDDGTWREGETVRVALTFSESMDVDTSEGTPSLGIELGAAGTAESERSADYESGSGTATLNFAYTLAAGDGDHTSMAVTLNSLALNGGTIRSSETAFDAALGHVGTLALGSSARSTGPQASFHDVPESHDGETPFTLTVAFGGAPDGLSPKSDAGSALEVEGGALTKARQAPGQSTGTWELTVTPSGSSAVTVRVPAKTCNEANAVCIGGRALTEAAEVSIAGTEETDNAITARVTAARASHDGSASFDIDFEFSHAPQGLSYRTIRDDFFDVTGGLIVRAKRLTQGESLGWRLTVQPDGDGPVTVDARATSDCEAAYAVCDAEGRMFDGGLAHTVPGPAPEPASETLPVVSIAAGETPVNEGTDLSFTLSRTGSTDAALAVNVSVSETGDVLAGAPPTSATFAEGASQTVLRIATVNDEIVEVASTVRVTLSATSSYGVDANAGRAEGVVESEDVEPMTARFTKVVDEHGGSGTFLLRFAFNHEPAGYSYKTVRDHLFDVTGGAIEKARRLVQGSNLGWDLRVAPDGFDPVTLSARATTDCSADYAACDAAGRMFDGELRTTIQGPPTLSVADATVEEAEGAVLDFEVTLSRSVTETVTVGYATADGTASAGADYTETSGTLTFAAHETSKTVSVPVLDDAHDEGSETMTFTLSNPSPERVKLADASAEGTIVNDDRMPQAWIARFGRTVAEQAMDAVQSRFTAPRAAGLSGSIAGMNLAELTDKADAEEAQEAEAEDGVGALSDWLAGEEEREPESRTLTGRDLVTGSSFAMTGGSAEAGFASFWGRGAVTRFDGREGEMTLDGEVSSAMLGADFSRDALVAGLMLSHARGTGGYRSPAGGGVVESTLTALFPYGRIEASERLSLWGMAGYGEGTLTLTPDGEPALRPDLSFLMGAVGARGVLAGEDDGGSVLALKSDAMAARTSTDAVSGSDGGNLAAAEGQVTRLRLALKGSHPFAIDGTAVLTPSLELGVRHDGGDAETGFGTDIGAGLALSDPARGLAADIRARGLLTHEAGGFGERGLSGTLSFDPAPETERGLSLDLAQTVGGASWGGADALLGRTTLAGLGAEREGDLDARRLDARIGYGFGVFENRYTGIPEFGLGLGNTDRELRLGWRLAERVPAGLAFEFGAEGTRREPAGGGAGPEHGLTVGAGWRLAGEYEIRVEAARREAANDNAEHTMGLRLTARW